MLLDRWYCASLKNSIPVLQLALPVNSMVKVADFLDESQIEP